MMMPWKPIAYLAGSAVVACRSPCGTSSSNSGSDASSDAVTQPTTAIRQGPCSDGVPYDNITTAFPQRDSQSQLSTVECVHRCGDTSVGYWGASAGPTPTVSALPTGSCNPGEPSCSMIAVKLTCDETIPDVSSPIGTLWQFECGCMNQVWICAGNYVTGGGGGCPDGLDGGSQESRSDGGSQDSGSDK